MKYLLILLLCGTAEAADLRPYSLSPAAGDTRYVNTSGDTMTGQLNGTSAVFSGSVTGGSMTVNGLGSFTDTLTASKGISVSTIVTTGILNSEYLQVDDGKTYIDDNFIGFGFSEDSNYAGWINYQGYLQSNSQFRDFYIANGKQSAMVSFIGASGNVGIGTTAPVDKLHLSSGTIYIDGTGTANNAILARRAETTYITIGQAAAAQVSMGWIYNANPAAASFLFATSGYSNPISMDGSAINFNTASHTLINMGGGIQHYARTKAEIMLIDPVAAGEEYYCSDCTASTLCISTGTAVTQFADISAKTSNCN